MVGLIAHLHTRITSLMDGITRFLRETGSDSKQTHNSTQLRPSLTRPIHYFQMDQNETCLHTKILHNRCF